MKIIMTFVSMLSLMTAGVASAEITDTDVFAIKLGYSTIAKNTVAKRVPGATLVDESLQITGKFVTDCGHVSVSDKSVRYIVVIDRSEGAVLSAIETTVSGNDLVKFNDMWEKCKPEEAPKS